MTVLAFVGELCKRFANDVINKITSLWTDLDRELSIPPKSRYPKIGTFLYLAKENEFSPYVVIDVTERKVAVQACYIEGNALYQDPNGMIVLLSWNKRYGWYWRHSVYDLNPEIALFERS